MTARARRAAEADARWMARCLELSLQAPGRIAPNPRVGCVIVDRRGQLLAEGFHRGPGTAHAEVDALKKLGGQAPGATLYVNLEPCAHFGRTPPCAPAVIAAGVRRVVIGGLDPARGHGGGAELVRAAGIAVTTGVLEEECRRHNAVFYTWAERGRPYVVLKAAMSLDGKIATARGESKWISNEASRQLGHQWRGELEAIVVGRSTVVADDPRLTARAVAEATSSAHRPASRRASSRQPSASAPSASAPAALAQPLRVVVASQAHVSPDARVFAAPGTLVACLRTAPAQRLAALRGRGAEVLLLPADRRRQAGRARVSIAALCRALARRGVTSLLVEGGGELHASFLAARMVDELRLFIAPLALGGRPGGAPGAGPSWLAGPGAARLAAAPRFAPLAPPQPIGDDVLLRLRPVW